MSVTSIVAVAGLVLSLVSLLLRQLDKRRTLKVSGGYAVISGDPRGEYWYSIEAVNPGQVPIKVRQFYIGLGKGEKLAFGPPAAIYSEPLPLRLETGDNVSCFILGPKLKQELREHGYEEKADVTLYT